MKAIILAGGFGTRISEESGVRPKPMVEIDEMPNRQFFSLKNIAIAKNERFSE